MNAKDERFAEKVGFFDPQSSYKIQQTAAASAAEIRLDIGIHDVKMKTAQDKFRDPVAGKKPSFRLLRAAAASFRQVPLELRKPKLPQPKSLKERTNGPKSAAVHALRGLVFISKSSEWPAVEKRFDELAPNGLLLKSLFGQCIGKMACIELRDFFIVL